MAARRLLIIMVVLLTISTLAAALVPPPEQREESSTSSTSSTTTSTENGRGSRLIDAEISAQGGTKSDRKIAVEAGDQLALEVSSDAPGEASLPDFGLLEFAGPGSPARFDLLLEEPGEYAVRFQGAGTISTIVAGKGR